MLYHLIYFLFFTIVSSVLVLIFVKLTIYIYFKIVSVNIPSLSFTFILTLDLFINTYFRL